MSVGQDAHDRLGLNTERGSDAECCVELVGSPKED